MPPSLPRSLDDLILDGLVGKIAAHRDADALISSAFSYDVQRDSTTPYQDLTAPLVNLTEETDTPDRSREYVARFRVSCLVPTLDDDATAVARLYVLKEQVRRALTDRADYDVGQISGTISSIKRPTWTRATFEDDDLSLTILAGSWSVEVTYAYEAADISGTPLEEISIELIGRFSALYPLGGPS